MSCPDSYLYSINSDWEGRAVGHRPVDIQLMPSTGSVKVLVSSPFYNDPPRPGGSEGEPFAGLWDYEVVETFFLNDKDQYLEVELCPHGQHLVLLLNGKKNAIKEQLRLTYSAKVSGDHWSGCAEIPSGYFPPGVCRLNAYAIHGSAEGRTYEALYPAKPALHAHPDFHRLEYFQSIDFQGLLPENWHNYKSQLWQETLSS